MNVSRVFAKELAPIVMPREFVQFGPFADFAKILHVEPIQTKIIDFLDADLMNIAAIAANGSANDRSNMLKMDEEFEVEPNQFLQLRVEPLDDILIEVSQPGGQSVLYATKGKTTVISKPNPRHVFTTTLLDAAETEEWQVSDNDDSGVRKAKIKKLTITEYAGVNTIVSIGDGTGGATLATAPIAVACTASSSVTLQEDKLPQVEFLDIFALQQSAAGADTKVVLEIEEDNPLIHSSPSQPTEMFVVEGEIPYFRVINPLWTAQSRAAFGYAGYKYYFDRLKAKEVPKVATYIPTARFGSGKVEVT